MQAVLRYIEVYAEVSITWPQNVKTSISANTDGLRDAA